MLQPLSKVHFFFCTIRPTLIICNLRTRVLFLFFFEITIPEHDFSKEIAFVNVLHVRLDKRRHSRALNITLGPRVESQVCELRNPFHGGRLDDDPTDEPLQTRNEVRGIGNAELPGPQRVFQDLPRHSSPDLERPPERPFVGAEVPRGEQVRRVVGFREVDGAGESGDSSGGKRRLVDDVPFLNLLVVIKFLLLALLLVVVVVEKEESVPEAGRTVRG